MSETEKERYLFSSTSNDRTVEDNNKKKLVSKKIKGVLEGDKEDGERELTPT